MALDSPKLQDVLEQIRSGFMQLPDFQREWKWDDQRIRELLATVTLDYPLGVVMTLETGARSRFRARPLTGASTAGPVDPGMLLLDGQQRLTSLFQALYLDRPVQTVDGRGNELQRWYYLDIAKSVYSPSDRDEAIVSVPADRVLRRDAARREPLDLTDVEAECRTGYFPLNIVFDVRRVHRWQRAFVGVDDENWDLWSRFEQDVIQHVRSFLIPMIKLGTHTTPDAVCSVFERVNTGGVPLNVFELLTATYAGDRAYEDSHGDYYRLPDIWQDVKKGLATAYPVLGRIEAGVDDGLSTSDFLQAVTLVRNWERRRDRPTAAISCKRRDLLELPLADFDRLTPRLTEAFEWVGGFLTEQCIVRVNDLPYRSQLIPLAAVRAILGETIDDPAMRERVTRWYWCGVLGEMYSGATESRFARDVEQLIAWTDPDAPEPDTVAEAVFVADRLDTLTTRNSAAYKGIYALLIKHGAVDWYYSDEPLNPGAVLQYAVDIRQIFPKAWLQRQAGGHTRANSIVNKSPLSYRAGRGMVGSPASYLDVLASDTGANAAWVDAALATHLIDPATLRAADFDAFYADRSRRLVDLVDRSMGKTTIYRDKSPR
ncbi:GmrSD restriction endonuclease domain-containing protein [Nocardia arizonensis]|uniref:GmrSD restriction endonuclease domain-containing protein n=1 Tax=Nocardia arizonensis TaxID=1141647 RepID=UPI000A84A98D|nr:DUF262 domain-containing protein [Nocardia arizonensis]